MVERHPPRLFALEVYTWYTYSVCSSRRPPDECPPRPSGPAQRGAEVRPASTERVPVTDGRGLAVERRTGLHDAAAPRTGRARRDRRRRGRAVAEALPNHRRRRTGADRLAPDAARSG